MDNPNRRSPSGSGGPGKSTSSSGISATEARQLKERIDALEKMVRDSLDEKNQWNSVIREWMGQDIYILLVHRGDEHGLLRWVDRYTLGIERADGQTVIVHKAAIATIRLYSPHPQST